MTREAEAKIELGIVPAASEVFGRKYRKFTELVADLRAVNELKRSAEEDSKRLNKELQSMWADVDAKTVLDNGAKVTLVSSSNSSIDKVKLVELGVRADIIVAATKTTAFQFVKITAAK